MSVSALAWPTTSVRIALSDRDYGVITTRAASGALATSRGEIWPAKEGNLRLKAWIEGAPKKGICVEIDVPPPAWLVPALQSAAELLGLERDWDSYGAPPISTSAIVSGIEVLSEIMSKDSLPPVFVPTSLGGCQLEWHTQWQDVEIEVSPIGATSVFFQDRARNAEGEGILLEHLNGVKEILRELVP